MTKKRERFKILVVCTANICRSPLAEHLLRAKLGDGQQPIEYEVSSAGILGWDASKMEPSAAAELRRLGGDPTAFRARSFTAQFGEDADLILTAAVEHRAHVLQELPQALRRTFTLLEFAHLVSEVPLVQDVAGLPRDVVARAAAARGAASIEQYDIRDPYAGTPDIHREAANVIDNAVRSVVVGLTGRRTPCRN